MKYSDKLRKMADWLDQHDTVGDELDGTWDYPSVGIWTSNKEHFMRVASGLGSFKKSAYSGSVTAKHEHTENDSIVFVASAHLTGACERKPRLDENGNPVVKIIPERRLEEYDYSCPESFLNMGD